MPVSYTHLLQLKDLETIESRIQKVQKQAQTGGDKAAKLAYDVLVQYKDALDYSDLTRMIGSRSVVKRCD